MKTFLWSFLASVAVLVTGASAERVLFLLPVASKSHVNVFEPLVKAVAQKGNDVVNLSPVKSPNMPENVKQIQIITVEDIFGDMANPFEIRKMGKIQSFLNGSFDNLLKACDTVLRSDQLQQLVLPEEKFDLVVVDILMNYCLLGAVQLWQAPTIMVSTFAAPAQLARAVGNRLPPSFVADPLLGHTHKMTLVERMKNSVFGLMSDFLSDLLFLPPMEKMYKELLPNGKSLAGIHEILANTSMLFSNSHFTLTYPRPLLPDCVEIGGMHIRPAKPLPIDIDDFVRGAGKDGFIFFSLGSIVPAKLMPEEYRQIFVRVFSRLKQRVIWKWEEDTMDDLPSNVLLRKFLPQQDILGHPNIKLFMTHGGLLSTQEAAYHGVPLLGFPIFADQDLNIKQAESTGYATFFEILELTEEKLENAIVEMLTNSRYSSKAKTLARIVRDRPQTPLETAVFWIEYVLRHKGAPHLRSAARDLNFFQYYLLDVTLTILSIVILTLVCSYHVLKLTVFKILTKIKIKSE